MKSNADNSDIINKSIDLPAERQFEFQGRKVTGLAFKQYTDDALAFQVVFDSGKPTTISVNLPLHAFVLGPGEFFLKNFQDGEELAKALAQADIVEKASAIAAPAGEFRVPIVKVTANLMQLAK